MKLKRLCVISLWASLVHSFALACLLACVDFIFKCDSMDFCAAQRHSNDDRWHNAKAYGFHKFVFNLNLYNFTVSKACEFDTRQRMLKRREESESGWLSELNRWRDDLINDSKNGTNIKLEAYALYAKLSQAPMPPRFIDFITFSNLISYQSKQQQQSNEIRKFLLENDECENKMGKSYFRMDFLKRNAK